MDATELGKKIEERFGDEVVWAGPSPKRLYVRVPPASLGEVVGWLRESIPGFRLATSTGIDLRAGVGVFHHFAVNGMPLVITVKVVAPKPDPCVLSLATMMASASWIEREIQEFLGVRFEGHPDPRRLLKARAFPDDVHPLRRDFDVREFKEGIGEVPEF